MVDAETLGRIFFNELTKSCRDIGRMLLTDSCFSASISSSRTGPMAASLASAVKSLPEYPSVSLQRKRGGHSIRRSLLLGNPFQVSRGEMVLLFGD